MQKYAPTLEMVEKLKHEYKVFEVIIDAVWVSTIVNIALFLNKKKW